MKNKQLHKSFCYIVLTLLLLIVSVIGGGFIVPVFADTREYTDVLDDLQKDENFNVLNYPLISGNFTPQLIQIAEGVNGELFVYIYHPCGKMQSLAATSINISTSAKDNKYYENYRLELINSSGTLYKYKVKDFEIKEDNIRYYDISSIYRKWINGVDDKPANDNTVSEKAFVVGQLWTVITSNGGVIYFCDDVEVIEVTSQMIGLRRYDNGLEWSGIEKCDAHYIAFSCYHEIDKLLSADIDFYTQSYEVSNGKGKLGEDKIKQSKTVTASDKGASKNKTWQRMSSTQDFIAELKIDGEEKETLSNYDWIINFYETEFKLDNKWWNILTPVLLVNEIKALANGGDVSYLYDISGTFVSDVTLMRLEFEHNGVIYNLGVVSDKQTGSLEPTNPDWLLPDWLQNLWSFIKSVPWWGWLLIVVGIIAVICFVIAIIKFGIKAVFNFIWLLIKKVFEGLWWLICLPFRLIKALVNKIRGE